MQILLVDDEKIISTTIREGLLLQGWAVDLASSGEEALEKIEINQTYDLIILDIMLPGITGLDVLTTIRKTSSHIPIIILTAKSSTTDRVSGLDRGADDYLIKPFSLEELLARMRAVLRRGNKADPPKLSIDSLIMDPAAHKVTRNNRAITLTTREYALLEYFLRNQGKLLSRTKILEHVWDYNYEGFSNIVETYIKYLRRKLRTSPTDSDLIHTIRGSGYIMKKPE